MTLDREHNSSESKKQSVINVGPMATNVLDLVDIQLYSANNQKVIVKREGCHFAVYVDGKLDIKTLCNISASYRLNMLEVRRDEQ